VNKQRPTSRRDQPLPFHPPETSGGASGLTSPSTESRLQVPYAHAPPGVHVCAGLSRRVYVTGLMVYEGVSDALNSCSSGTHPVEQPSGELQYVQAAVWPGSSRQGRHARHDHRQCYGEGGYKAQALRHCHTAMETCSTHSRRVTADTARSTLPPSIRAWSRRRRAPPAKHLALSPAPRCGLAQGGTPRAHTRHPAGMTSGCSGHCPAQAPGSWGPAPVAVASTPRLARRTRRPR
jgi:hypothetical protein